MYQAHGSSYYNYVHNYLKSSLVFINLCALSLITNYTYAHEKQIGAFKNHAYALNAKRAYQNQKHQHARIKKQGQYWVVLVNSSNKNHRSARHHFKQTSAQGWCVNGNNTSWVDLEHGSSCRYQTTKVQNLSIYDHNRRFRYLASVSAGPVWGSGGTIQNIWIEPSVLKAYAPNNNENTFGYGELYTGIEFPLNSRLNGQFGIVLGASNNVNMSGDIWDNADNELNNYSYQYQLQHTFIGIKGKFLLQKTYFVVPWVSANIGMGINSAKNFTNQPKNLTSTAIPNFTDNTDLAFSYRLGVGAQYNITDRAQIGIGYEFADWGTNSLGPIAGTQSTDSINMNNYYANELMINLTYYW